MEEKKHLARATTQHKTTQNTQQQQQPNITFNVNDIILAGKKFAFIS
jgi:hypothetical protein